MSDEFTDLLQRAETPVMQIDPYAVVLGGRRRQRRRVLTSAVAVATVVAVVVGGWAVSELRQDRAVPAAHRVERLTLTPQAWQENVRTPVQRIEVTADVNTGATTFTTVVEGRSVDLGTVTPTDPKGAQIAVSRVGTPPMVLAVIPGGDHTRSLFPDIVPESAGPDGGLLWSAANWLPQTGRAALVFGYPTRQAALRVAALRWVDPVSGVQFTDEAPVASVQFPGPSGGTRQLYVSSVHQLVGLTETRTDSGNGAGLFDQDDSVGLPAGAIGLFGGDGAFYDTGLPSDITVRNWPANRYEEFRYGLLPAGATGVHMVDRKGADLPLVVLVHPVPGTSLWGVYTEQQVAGASAPLIDAVAAMRWKDASGVSHTTPYTPPVH